MQPTIENASRPGVEGLTGGVGEAVLPGVLLGFVLYLGVRLLLRGFYTVDQNERAVKTVFGRAQRLGSSSTLELPSAQALRPDERERYVYPQVAVIPPGGPYFRWPWEQVHKVNIATATMNLAYDPDSPEVNEGGSRLDAVTKDHLNTKIVGQLRFRVAEENLYAFLFGVKGPIAHVMGYFVSILRQRIASFEAPARGLAAGEDAPLGLGAQAGVSINDLRKNLRELNDRMEQDCASSSARYGVQLDACLITGIDPPDEVESALAAINTAHNHVSSELSLAHASADQRIVQSKRAVEIETLKVQAEAEPLRALSRELAALDASGPGTLDAYVRNLRLSMLGRARRVFLHAEGNEPLPTPPDPRPDPSPMTARLGAAGGGR
ncbi:MAG: SPFH domain-containing protein [Polyangiaceae bacterium]|jgi:regulator of protease activity HflC (stomatin/prohibitin superfamily)|nr:SPFH domain-containing protein [Polyangiaceae bacterium]